MGPYTVPQKQQPRSSMMERPRDKNQQTHFFLLADIHTKNKDQRGKKSKALTLQPRSPASTLILGTCSLLY